jgi:hypothetical protein
MHCYGWKIIWYLGDGIRQSGDGRPRSEVIMQKAITVFSRGVRYYGLIPIFIATL